MGVGRPQQRLLSCLDVYTGKKGNTVEHNLGARVVKDLTKDFQNKWHYVFFDNFFFMSKHLICDRQWGSMVSGQPGGIGSCFLQN